MTEHKTDMIITRIEKKKEKRNEHNRTKNRHKHY